MKAIFIGNKRFTSIDLLDSHKDDALSRVMTEYTLMESHVIYFSAGDAKIKEILINKDPFYSC